ncbi:probable diacetyl reductase [(R)-acetoin forming] 2 [Monosporozyma unispora]
MRALAYFGKGDIHFTNSLAEPKELGPDELRLSIAYTGICGTDLHEATSEPIFFPKDGHRHEISNNELPQAMGHEMAGIVTEIGPAVTKFKVGDHVTVEPTGTCRDRYRWPDSPNANKPKCSACKKGMYNTCAHLGLIGNGVQSGGLAERVVINESHCYKVPAYIPLEVVALIQPIAVSWHAVGVSKYRQGGSVLILGGGPIGLGTILALYGHGCTDIVVSEPAKIRRDLAEKMGATTFDPTLHSSADNVRLLREMAPGGDGFDYCFDCSGIPETLQSSIQCLTFRGTAVNVAMWTIGKPIDFFPMDITKQEKSYAGSMCYTYHDFEEVIDAFEKGLIDPKKAEYMITAKVSLERAFEDGIMRLITRKEETIKVLVTPNNFGELDVDNTTDLLAKL